MQQTEHAQLIQESSADDEETSWIDILLLLVEYRKLIVTMPIAAAVLAAGISFALPNVYKSYTRLLPPQEAQSSATAILSQLGGAAGLAAGMAGLKNPNDVYVGMLKSRTIADALISQFDLKKAYDVRLMELARKQLGKNTTITAGKDGLITIEVEDRDQKRVAALANAYVSELRKLTKVIAVTEASKRRLFFERQLEQTKDNLANAEVRMKQRLDTRGVISVDAESRASVETIGRLKAKISAKEIELSSMTAFVTTSNPNWKRVEQELVSLREELSRLENGRIDVIDGSQAQPAGKTDGLESIKLLRDVKYYQMLYELLAKQYEIARLDESKDSSIIQVLDPAVEPERKSKPLRSLIVMGSAAAAFFAAVGLAFLLEALHKAESSTVNGVRWAQLKSQFRKK